MKLKFIIIGLCAFFISSVCVFSSKVTIPFHDMGVTYNGLHKKTNPNGQDITNDLNSIKSSGFLSLRSYYPQYSGSIALMPLAEKAGLKTLLSLFMFPDHLNDWVPDNYKNYIKPYLSGNSGNLLGVLVGNEDIDTSSAVYNAIIKYLKQVKSDNTKVAVSTAQTTDFWLNDARAASVSGLCDFIAVNIYPAFEWNSPDAKNQPQLNYVSLTPAQGLTSFIEQYDKIKKKYSKMQIVVTETGWPTTYGWVVNAPVVKQYQIGINNAQKYFTQISTWAKANKVNVYYYSMFDDWYGVNTTSQFNFHFGRLDTDGNKKKADSI